MTKSVFSRLREGSVVVALLALQCAQLTYGLFADGMALDELLYIASGYRQLALGDHRFGAEHPPLARLLVAAPLLPLNLKVRELTAADASSGWSWAYDFVHVDNAHYPLLRLVRIPIVVLSLLFSLLIWGWCREAHGPTAGLAALVLASLHPSLLAHGHLATTDLAGAFTMIATSWAMWRWCNAPGTGRALLVGVALGVALSTRLTAVLLVPIIVVVSLAWWRTSDGTRTRTRRLLGLFASMIVMAPLIIWAAYGFRHDPWPGEVMPRIVPLNWLQGIEGSGAARVLAFLKTARILPAAYLTSVEVYLIKSSLGHQAYLLGEISASGWPHYYLVAMAVKNTPGFLIAIVSTAFLWRRLTSVVALHWLIPAIVLFTAASLSRVQVGERYILPVYAYLIMVIASIVPRLLSDRGGAAVVTAVVFLHGGPTLWAANGGHLSYFNLLAGGRDQAHLVLADSNLDWGQDLPRLAAWARGRPDTPLQLAYWGTDDPGRYGIVREDLPGGGLYPTRNAARPFTGSVAVSPTLLVGLYPPPGLEWVYPQLLKRVPDDRAGVFLIYHFKP